MRRTIKIREPVMDASQVNGFGCAGMMHYCKGSDSAPDHLDVIQAVPPVIGASPRRRTVRK